MAAKILSRMHQFGCLGAPDPQYIYYVPGTTPSSEQPHEEDTVSPESVQVRKEATENLR